MEYMPQLGQNEELLSSPGCSNITVTRWVKENRLQASFLLGLKKCYCVCVVCVCLYSVLAIKHTNSVSPVTEPITEIKWTLMSRRFSSSFTPTPPIRHDTMNVTVLSSRPLSYTQCPAVWETNRSYTIALVHL